MTTVYDKAIFDTLINSCLAEGGDGDVLFVSSDYLSAAQRFTDYLKETANIWWTRDDRDGYVTFSNNQECIYLSNKELDVYPSLIIKLPFGSFNH